MTNLALTDRFVVALGTFHGAWANAELLTCYAIGKLLKISDLEAHILTAGMEFGRKATLLRNLAYHSEIANQAAFFKSLNILRDRTKRNVLAHGFLLSDEDSVTFIDRSRGGDYSATEHSFTLDEFLNHVEEMLDASIALQAALEVGYDRMQEFADAALSTSRKSSKSPDPPLSKA